MFFLFLVKFINQLSNKKHMVLESLINPFKAEEKPYKLFFLGILYSSAALFLSNWVFTEHASLLMVFFTVMASIPLLYNTIKFDEQNEIKCNSGIFKEHCRVIALVLFLFLGFTASFVFWYTLLPADMVQNTFHTQSVTIQMINSQLTGNYSSLSTFTGILLNNLKVLVFCILFAFLYGAGAIFIITWNASVISTAIGNFIRTRLASVSHELGSKYFNYFQIVSFSLLRYLVHGIPEMIAYFIAGLAGSIISVAVIKEKFGSKNFEKIILDSSDLILLSILILVMAALIEVYITPVLL